MQDIIWIDIDCSVNKIVGYVRGLPLLVRLGLVKLITSETLVRAFREFPDEVLEVFRTTFFWFRDL
jgi:hypothetical protein